MEPDVEEREAKILVDALREVLEPHLRRSGSLRRAAAILGRWLVEQASGAGGLSADHDVTWHAPAPAPDGVPPAPTAVPETVPGTADAAPPIVGPAAETVTTSTVTAAEVPLRLGDATVEVRIHDHPDAIESARRAAEPAPAAPGLGDGEDHEALDLELVAQRCRLKAEGCRLVVERRAMGSAAAWDHALQERIRGVLARARALPGCFVWALWREKDPPADGPLRTIASCYEALAEAAETMVQVDRPDNADGDLSEAMVVLAEAQSMLRTALVLSWLTRDDQDQIDAHLWLRHSSAMRNVFIERHMRLDDPADPASAEDLRARIAAVLARVRSRADRAKRSQQVLNRIRHHARALARDDGDAAHHWKRIAEAVQDLADGGVRPSDRRLREALGAAAGLQAPAEWNTPLLRSALAAAAPPDEEDVAEHAADRDWSGRVLAARSLLAGRSLVLIGGEPRAEAIARLREALGAGEVYWPALSEHGSGAAMRAPIERPDTGAVAVIIKLTGHLHADEAREYARGAGKACVSLTGGYSPEQVAEALLGQAERQLSAGRNGQVHG